MQIHLLDCKSPSSLFRQLGDLKLRLCMMILSELRDTYWGADFAYKMFQRAQAKLSEILETHSEANHASGLQYRIPQAPIAPLTPESTAFSQVQSRDQSLSSYPSLEDILAPEFSLGDGQYLFGTNELELR